MWPLRGTVLVAASFAMTVTASAETNADRIVKILSATIPSCWARPTLAEGQKAAPFSVSFKLTTNGSVESRPTAGKEPASDYERMTIESGVRAILRCAPYSALVTSGLPYEDWKDITIHFDPSQTDF
jgi:hypothetical protein